MSASLQVIPANGLNVRQKLKDDMTKVKLLYDHRHEIIRILNILANSILSDKNIIKQIINKQSSNSINNTAHGKKKSKKSKKGKKGKKGTKGKMKGGAGKDMLRRYVNGTLNGLRADSQEARNAPVRSRVKDGVVQVAENMLPDLLITIFLIILYKMGMISGPVAGIAWWMGM